MRYKKLDLKMRYKKLDLKMMYKNLGVFEHFGYHEKVRLDMRYKKFTKSKAIFEICCCNFEKLDHFIKSDFWRLLAFGHYR